MEREYNYFPGTFYRYSYMLSRALGGFGIIYTIVANTKDIPKLTPLRFLVFPFAYIIGEQINMTKHRQNKDGSFVLKENLAHKILDGLSWTSIFGGIGSLALGLATSYPNFVNIGTFATGVGGLFKLGDWMSGNQFAPVKQHEKINLEEGLLVDKVGHS